MWTTALDSGHRRASLAAATIDVLAEPGHGGEQIAAVRVTIPPGASMPRHDHGESDALLVPLSGELLLTGGDGHVERLGNGTLTVLAAGERVSVENTTAEPASMLVCFAPPTFVEALGKAPAVAATAT